MKKKRRSQAAWFQHIGLNALLLFLGSTCCLEGKDFGIQGELFAIEEESLLAALQRQIAQHYSEKNGGALLESIQDRVRSLKSPLVPSEALSPRTYYYDPTYVLKEAITDEEGRTLFAEGARMSPLKHTRLATGLLFFDGSNPSHLSWARSQRGPFKWILVSGNPFELEEKEERPVYFDQEGFYVSKFQIEHIPARITQDNLLLKIEEIPAEVLPAEGLLAEHPLADAPSTDELAAENLLAEDLPAGEMKEAP